MQIVLSLLYYIISIILSVNKLTYYKFLAFNSVLSLVIIGGYQCFFWIQHNNIHRKARNFKCLLDDFIPFWPIWVWFYSMAYYLAIGLIVVTIDSIEDGVWVIFGGIALFVIQGFFHFFFPVKTPNSFRRFDTNTISRKFLKFIQDLDSGRNCFPSMHCSIGTYIGLLLMPLLGMGTFLFIILLTQIFMPNKSP